MEDEKQLEAIMRKLERLRAEWDKLSSEYKAIAGRAYDVRRERDELKEKLEVIKKLVEQDLPQIIMTHYFRRRFYELTDFPIPDWFKEAMDAEDEADS